MIPTTLRSVCNLRFLDLSNNNVDADITEVIDRLPDCSLENLQELSLRHANITGSTLQFVSKLTSLTMLDVGGNLLSGSVPMEIGLLTNLTYLNLANNTLSGELPMEVGALTSLTNLDLSDNNFSGEISEDHFVGLMNLKYIDLSNNNLEFITDSHWVPLFNLERAWLTSCHLGPKFPKWHSPFCFKHRSSWEDPRLVLDYLFPYRGIGHLLEPT